VCRQAGPPDISLTPQYARTGLEIVAHRLENNPITDSKGVLLSYKYNVFCVSVPRQSPFLLKRNASETYASQTEMEARTGETYQESDSKFAIYFKDGKLSPDYPTREESTNSPPLQEA
jgi:hypothetical protein